MQTSLTLSAPALVRVLAFCILGAFLATLSFGSGWFVRYSFKEGLPATVERFQQRMESAIEQLRKYRFFDRIFEALLKVEQENLGFNLLAGPSRPPRERFRPRPSPTPSPGPTVAPTPRASPTAKPRPKPTPKPVVASLKLQVLEFLQSSTELPPKENQDLKRQVDTWSQPHTEDILGLAESVDKLVYVKDEVRRSFLLQLFNLSGVMELLTIESAEDLERLVMGWDVADLRRAYDEGKLNGLKALCQGRPVKFFLELARAHGPFKSCRDNLQALDEKRAQPGTATGSQGPSASTTAGAAPTVFCPAGGVYGSKPPAPWRCSVHLTLKDPFPLAARLVRYMDPVDRALREHLAGQTDQALPALTAHLKVYPNHPFAAAAVADILYDRKDFQGMKDSLTPWLTRCPGNAKWLFMMAAASQALGDVENAKVFANKVLEADYKAEPMMFTRLKEFYATKDHARELLDAVANGIRFGDYPLCKDDECPSGICFRYLGELRDEIVGFCHGYPSSHPELTVIKSKRRKLEARRAQLKPNQIEAARRKEAEWDARTAEIMADTAKKMVWPSLAKYFSSVRLNGCPSGGRYTLLRQEWVECSVHRGIFPDRLVLPGSPSPTPEEEALASRSVLNGVLNSDQKRRLCFAAQRDYLNGKGTAGVQAGEITTDTLLPGGQKLACPASGVLKAEAVRSGGAVVRCSIHGSFQEYFAGMPSGGEEGP